MQEENPNSQEPTREESIKALRVSFDGISKLIPFLLGSTPNTVLAKRNAQSTKHWLGKTLKFCGVETPYQNSMDKNSKVIDPTADVNEDWKIPTEGTLTQDLHHIRNIVSDLISQINKLTERYFLNPMEIKSIDQRLNFKRLIRSFDLVWEKANEVLHWLGEELADERERQEAAKETKNTDPTHVNPT